MGYVSILTSSVIIWLIAWILWPVKQFATYLFGFNFGVIWHNKWILALLFLIVLNFTSFAVSQVKKYLDRAVNAVLAKHRVHIRFAVISNIMSEMRRRRTQVEGENGL